MKKILTMILLSFLYCSSSFSESYYFKDCKISNAVTANYTINFKKNIIEVELKAIDGNVQNFSDKIKSIEKDKIVSEKIKSAKGKDLYYQYYLNSKLESVTKLLFKKVSGVDMEVFSLSEKRKTHCAVIKADWDKLKIKEAKISKEQKEISEAQSSLVKCQGNNYKQWTNCKGLYKD